MAFIEKPTQRTDWETPQWLFDYWDRRFNFQTDVCAEDSNAKCGRYFTKHENGLAQTWTGPCWMNPPYGRGVIAPWIRKAYESALGGNATVVCLIPNRSDQAWWELVIRGVAHYVRGRVRFVGAPSGSMFCSVIAIFHAHLDPGSASAIISVAEMKAEQAYERS